MKKLDVRIRRDSWPIRYLCRDFTWLSSPIYLGRGPFWDFHFKQKILTLKSSKQKIISMHCFSFKAESLSLRHIFGEWQPFTENTTSLPILTLRLRSNAHNSCALEGTNFVQSVRMSTWKKPIKRSYVVMRTQCMMNKARVLPDRPSVFISFAFSQMILLELFRTIDQGLRGQTRMFLSKALTVLSRRSCSLSMPNFRVFSNRKTVDPFCLKITELSHRSRWPLSQLEEF